MNSSSANRGSGLVRPGVLLMLTAILWSSPLQAEDWPQLQKNPGHTGYSPDQPSLPAKVKWVRRLDEPTFTAAPPIVADGKVFVGTHWGNLLALNRDTGKTEWSYAAGGSIAGTCAWDDGIVYAGSMDHQLHAVRSSDGTKVWTFPTGAGIWAAPVVADGLVFIASRDGHAYAVDAKTGQQTWKIPVGGMVQAAPAYDSGVLYVGGGDNRVYALDGKTGREIWKTDVLPGMAIRDYWLVATHGVVIVSTQLVLNGHGTFGGLDRSMMDEFRKANDGKMLVQDELLEKVHQWLTENPHAQTLHVLDALTGKPRFVAPVIQVHGAGCTGPLPTVGPDGLAYLMFANVRLTASGWAFPGKLDLATGKLTPLIQGRYWIDTKQHEWQAKPGEKLGRQSTFDVGFCVTDQSWGLSRAGDMLLTLRDPGWAGGEGAYSFINLATGDDRWLLDDPGRQVNKGIWEGCFGGHCHTTTSPLVVSGNQLFHKEVRNVIFCFEGK